MSRRKEIAAFVEQVYPDLDLYTYYQLLELEPAASSEQIRDAFYRQAARLHPDRFATLGDATVRDKIVAIYARIAEAYKILGDGKKRSTYDAGIAQGRVRFQDVEREKKGPQNPEDAVAKPETKKFLRLALQSLRTGDLKGAQMNFKFALSYEPQNAYLSEQVAAIEAELKKRNLASSATGATK